MNQGPQYTPDILHLIKMKIGNVLKLTDKGHPKRNLIE